MHSAAKVSQKLRRFDRGRARITRAIAATADNTQRLRPSILIPLREADAKKLPATLRRRRFEFHEDSNCP